MCVNEERSRSIPIFLGSLFTGILLLGSYNLSSQLARDREILNHLANEFEKQDSRLRSQKLPSQLFHGEIPLAIHTRRVELPVRDRSEWAWRPEVTHERLYPSSFSFELLGDVREITEVVVRNSMPLVEENADQSRCPPDRPCGDSRPAHGTRRFFVELQIDDMEWMDLIRGELVYPVSTGAETDGAAMGGVSWQHFSVPTRRERLAPLLAVTKGNIGGVQGRFVAETFYGAVPGLSGFRVVGVANETCGWTLKIPRQQVRGGAEEDAPPVITPARSYPPLVAALKNKSIPRKDPAFEHMLSGHRRCKHEGCRLAEMPHYRVCRNRFAATSHDAMGIDDMIVIHAPTLDADTPIT